MKCNKTTCKIPIYIGIFVSFFIIFLLLNSEFIPEKLLPARNKFQPPAPLPYKLLQIGKEMTERVRFLQERCQGEDVKNYLFNFSQNNERFYVVNEKKIAFCKVPKAGSSYLTRLFLALKNSKWTLDRIVNISREKIHVIGNRYGTKKPLKQPVNGFINLLTVRDPYTRLYSAYVDKVFLGRLHNKIDWTRLTKSEHSYPYHNCTRGISFQDFLNIILDSAKAGEKINRHWSPVYLLCHPCNMTYDFIAKQESLTGDFNHFIDILNLPPDRRTLMKKLSRDRSFNETIRGLLMTYFKQNIFQKKCSEKHTFMKIWRAFQIQGILRNDIKIPKINGNGNTDQFLEIVLDHIHKFPVNASQRKHQRRESLISAFKEVSKSTIKRIQELYYNDFVLFNYSFLPPQ